MADPIPEKICVKCMAPLEWDFDANRYVYHEEKVANVSAKIEPGDILVRSNKYGKRVRGCNNYVCKADPALVSVRKPVDINDIKRKSDVSDE